MSPNNDDNFDKLDNDKPDNALPSFDIVLQPTLLLMTHAPTHPMSEQGLAYAKQFYTAWQQVHQTPVDLTVFFYSDAAMLANRLIWLPADIPNMAKDWQHFAQQTSIVHQVCVSTALARGVVDTANAQRHQLQGDNLADGFALVGLGELAMHLHRCSVVKQF